MNYLLVCSGIDVVSITRMEQALSRDTGFKHGVSQSAKLITVTVKRVQHVFSGKGGVKESLFPRGGYSGSTHPNPSAAEDAMRKPTTAGTHTVASSTSLAIHLLRRSSHGPLLMYKSWEYLRCMRVKQQSI